MLRRDPHAGLTIKAGRMQTTSGLSGNRNLAREEKLHRLLATSPKLRDVRLDLLDLVVGRGIDPDDGNVDLGRDRRR